LRNAAAVLVARLSTVGAIGSGCLSCGGPRPSHGTYRVYSPAAIQQFRNLPRLPAFCKRIPVQLLTAAQSRSLSPRLVCSPLAREPCRIAWRRCAAGSVLYAGGSAFPSRLAWPETAIRLPLE